MYFLGSSGAKDQLPGHKRLIDCLLPESKICSLQAMNPDIDINNKQSSTLLEQNYQYFTEFDYLEYRQVVG